VAVDVGEDDGLLDDESAGVVHPASKTASNRNRSFTFRTTVDGPSVLRLVPDRPRLGVCRSLGGPYERATITMSVRLMNSLSSAPPVVLFQGVLQRCGRPLAAEWTYAPLN
jgi:hypothetical protein